MCRRRWVSPQVGIHLPENMNIWPEDNADRERQGRLQKKPTKSSKAEPMLIRKASFAWR